MSFEWFQAFQSEKDSSAPTTFHCFCFFKYIAELTNDEQ